MPIPPTKSDMPAMAANSAVKVFDVADAMSIMSAQLIISKSEAAPS